MRFLIFALLTGFASMPQGLTIDADEAKACAAVGCTPWTQEELLRLVQRAFAEGFQRGAQSAGRAL